MQADQSGRGGAKPVVARVARIFAWLAGITLVLLVLDLLRVPVADWIRQLFKEVRAVPATAIASGIVLETLQTVPIDPSAASRSATARPRMGLRQHGPSGRPEQTEIPGFYEPAPTGVGGCSASCSFSCLLGSEVLITVPPYYCSASIALQGFCARSP